jgi:hypothetical protein
LSQGHDVEIEARDMESTYFTLKVMGRLEDLDLFLKNINYLNWEGGALQYTTNNLGLRG